jgi:hypothetical protein
MLLASTCVVGSALAAAAADGEAQAEARFLAAPCVQLHEGVTQTLSCPEAGQNVYHVLFADYGTPSGNCSAGFQVDPTCTTSASAVARAKLLCLGKPGCALESSNDVWGPDPCPGQPKTLTVQVDCDSGDHCYDITFNRTLGDNMVLQQQPGQAAVYGVVTGNTANVSVTVTDEAAAGSSYTVDAVVSEAQGLWKAMLHPTKAGGNYSITATATCATEQVSATIRNVTFGDVWCVHVFRGLSCTE